MHLNTLAILMVIFTSLFTPLCSHGEEYDAQLASLQTLQQAIRQIQQQTSVPAIGVAVVTKEGPIWVDAMGMTDELQSTPASVNTLFRIGSISKMFTSMAIMQLVDQKLLSLDDKLSERLPDLVFDNPWRATHPITVAHLLEHTTGWDVHTGKYAIRVDDRISLKDALNLHTDARVSRWIPGTRHSYSNTGPVVAARIVEEISGMDFDEYMRRFVFAPMQMLNSSFLKTPEFDVHGATGFGPVGAVEYEHIYSRPSSTMHASPNGMANALLMMLNRGQFADQQIIAPASVLRMETPATTLGDSIGMHSGYGLGIQASGFEDQNMPFFGHSGGVPGFAAEFIYQPELGSGFAFMINQDNPQAFQRLSQVLRRFILSGRAEKAPIKRAPLPKNFKGMDGLYLPINTQLEFARIVSDITDVLRIETDAQSLHRSPFWGGGEVPTIYHMVQNLRFFIRNGVDCQLFLMWMIH